MNKLICNFQFVRSFSNQAIRVRFAPSPTGNLHIGGLRTALYNYLFAQKHKNGKFILRIEDTDQTRKVDGAMEQMSRILEDFGIIPDEGPVVGGGFGPYIQSERLEIYRKFTNQLLEEGKAYRCFCSSRRLNILKQEQNRRNEVQRYDNRCRNLSQTEIEESLSRFKPHVIRVPLSDVTVTYDDLIFGSSSSVIQEGDPVVMKSDGFPTYHLANVVDDHMMKISHVIRGKEWLSSLHKHLHLYHLFGWDPPTFCHVPLLMNKSGKKLSKREGEVFVESYLKKGFSQASIINFVSCYGAGFINQKFPVLQPNPKELIKTLSKSFELSKLSHTDAKINFDKLNEISSSMTSHQLQTERSKIFEASKRLIKNKYPQSYLFRDDIIESSLNQVLDRLQNRGLVHLHQLVEDQNEFLWMRPKVENIPLLNESNYIKFLQEFLLVLQEVDWTDETNFSKICKQIVKKHSKNVGNLWKILRLQLAGVENGMPVVDLMQVLQKSETLLRLEYSSSKFNIRQSTSC